VAACALRALAISSSLTGIVCSHKPVAFQRLGPLGAKDSPTPVGSQVVNRYSI